MYCQALGGHLLSLANVFNNALITGIQLTTLDGTNGWLGGRRAQNGSWYWSDGTPFTYAKWAPGQPSTGDCIYMNSDDKNWRTIDCTANLPYLCQLPTVITPNCDVTQTPIACPAGSRYIQELNSCLHADNNLVSALLAEKYCKAFDGHLFSIHDGDTDNFLTGISYTLINGDQFYIGAKKNASTYAWTDGTAFDYTNWKNGEPQLECVVIQRESAAWVTVNCANQLPFMCNIPPIVNGGCTYPPMITMETTASLASSSTPTMIPLNCLPAAQQQLYNCQKGWQYFPATGFYYLVFFDSSYSQGEAYCVSQGGHLASVHSEAEDDFISNLCCDSDCSFRKDGDGWSAAGLFMIGAQKVNGAWSWLDGTPWDYQKPICESGDARFILIDDDNCTGDDCVDYDWVTAGSADGVEVPYFVCKRNFYS
ncbi:unnamed protein product, partial [Mesorhabditis belari]|uniref:C-type lectin domain-containing protein n=1 Tax=Mesorhabditis belari TaxID=2138241 RepID=A0AAF3FHK3_9BILA